MGGSWAVGVFGIEEMFFLLDEASFERNLCMIQLMIRLDLQRDILLKNILQALYSKYKKNVSYKRMMAICSIITPSSKYNYTYRKIPSQGFQQAIYPKLLPLQNKPPKQKDRNQAHSTSFPLLFLSQQPRYVRDCQGLCADFIYPLIKMKFTHTILLLSVLAVLSLGQIAPILASPSSSSSSLPTFTTTPIDLSLLNDTTIQTDLYSSFQVMNESKQFHDSIPILAAALLVTASTGDKTYYLYVDGVDAEGQLHEYEGVVMVIPIDDGNSTTYNYSLISVTEKPVAKVLQSNATSLDAFLDEVATGYSKYTDSQIAADSYLSTVGINIEAANPLVFSTKMIAVYTKMVGLATAYVIFYQGTITESISLWKAVAYNDKVNTFIESFERVVVPSTVQQ